MKKIVWETTLVLHLTFVVGGVSQSTISSSFSSTSKTLVRFFGRPPAEASLTMQAEVAAEAIGKILSVPRYGKEVTLLTEGYTEEGSFVANAVMASIQEPLTLLRFPKEYPGDDLRRWMVDELPGLNSTRALDYNIYSKSDSKVVIVTSGDESWWPFHQPPKRWLVHDIILVSLKEPCPLKLFETVFIARTPSVSFLCPYRARGAEEPQASLKARSKVLQPSLKVWSWIPYSEGQHAVDLGFWDPEVFNSWDRFFVDRFTDMSRKFVEVETMLDVPFVYTKKDGSVTGLSYRLLVTCAGVLNFDFSVTPLRDTPFSELEGRVRVGELDMFINYAPMTTERYEFFDIIGPYHYDGYGLILKNPPPLPRWKNIIYPFSPTVWLAVCLSMFCTSVVYHLFYYKYETSYFNNALSVLQCMLSNVMEYVPTSWRIRSFLMVWWLISWLLHMSYTCNLIAVLTVPVFPRLIQTVEGLVNSSNRLCMLDYGDFVPDALRVSTNPVLYGLGQILDMVPMNYSLEYVGEEYCLELVLAGTHAHTDAQSYLEFVYLDNGLEQQVYSVKERLYPGYIYQLTEKRTPWSYKIHDIIMKLTETGLIVKWYKDEMASFGTFTTDRDTELKPLSLDHLQGSFYLMVGGIVVSALALGIEYIQLHSERKLQS